MSDTERFRRIQAHRRASSPSLAESESIDKHLAGQVDDALLEKLEYGSPYSTSESGLNLAITRDEVGDILNELRSRFHSERVDFMLDQLKADLLRSIIVPFGLGRVLSAYDKVGGNVDTLHNVANKDHEEGKEIEIKINGKIEKVKVGIYANKEEEGKYIEHLERNGYKDDKGKIHGDERYTGKNKHDSAQQKSEGVEDGYTGKTLGPNDKKDQDHVVSAKETYDDPQRILANLGAEELANVPKNLVATQRTINRSKGQESVESLLTKKARLEDLESRQELTAREKKERDDLRIRLEKLKHVDWERAKRLDEDARRAQRKRRNWTYYTSKMFARRTLEAGAREGAKTALQQAIGIVVVEFLAASIEETKRAIGSVREGAEVIPVVKASLVRVKDRILDRWRDVFVAMRSGFLQGFLSSLLTTLLNTIVTTGKRAIRMIREGMFSFVKGIKVLLFPDEGVSVSESLHAASKVLVSGAVLAGGIALEEAAEKIVMSFSAILGMLVAPVTAVIVGAFTALAVAVACYLLDRLDVFGAVQLEEDRFVVESLDRKIVELEDEWDSLVEDVAVASR